MAGGVLGGWTGQGPWVSGRSSQGAAAEDHVFCKGRLGWGNGVDGVTTRALEEDVVKITGSGPTSLGFITKARSEEEAAADGLPSSSCVLLISPCLGPTYS